MRTACQCSPLTRRVVAGACAAVLGAAFYALSSRAETAVPQTARQVADLLDHVVQRRFAEEIVSRFGISRVAAAGGHLGIGGDRLTPRTIDDINSLKKVDAANRDYDVFFFHCAHVPGRDSRAANLIHRTENSRTRLTVIANHIERKGNHIRMLRLPNGTLREVADHGERTRYQAHVLKQLQDRVAVAEHAATDALVQLKKGHPAQSDRAGWTYAMRPIRASKSNCIGCHIGAKIGDTLGIMIYAVNTRPRAPQPSLPNRYVP